MNMITSTQNNQVKNWRKLQQRKYREKTGSFLVEGFHLVEEAVNSDWDIATLIVVDGVDIPDWAADLDYELVDDYVFGEIAQTETFQGIAAVVKMKEQADIVGDKLLLIDQVQDPGNLGTIIRTADAAGFSGIMLGKGTVDVFNEKVIRATQGSIFHISIVTVDLPEEVKALQTAGYTVLASALEDAVPYNELKVGEQVALIMGNEGAGISKELLALADKKITIPIYGQAESLNVSIAAGVLMYHLAIP